MNDGLMRRRELHGKLCNEMHDLYIRKNNDYGDVFHDGFVEEGLAMVRIRLGDKFRRFQTLSRNKEQMVKDESIEDTLMDLANYAIMALVELEDMNHDGREEPEHSTGTGGCCSQGNGPAIQQTSECG